MRTNRSLSRYIAVIVFCAITTSNMVLVALSYIVEANTRRIPIWLSSVFNSPVYTLAISILLGTLISGVFSRLFLRPLNELVAATKKVAGGDFSVRVKPTDTNGEIDTLVDSFNEMAQELGSNELFKKDFINSFSHEFKTPIVSIRGFARQLERDDLTDEERKQYAGIIVRESERLSNLASNVLLLNKLETQTFLPEKKRYRLDEQLRENVLLFEKQWSEKELELDIDLKETYIDGNEEMLSQVFINIIGNAVKFTPRGGKLSVRCERQEDAVVVTISDTGIGMDEETVKRAFDQFYQGSALERIPSHSQEGNGLGLALAKRIVEMNGGTILVESELGKGSAFTVRLPA